jgi:uncharacterized protein YcgI (DUF1989 family)
VVGNVNVPPLHIAATCVNVGVTCWFTVTVIVAVVAHCPAAGVNVYVVVAVLLIAGDHVPMYPLLDVVGILSASPEQIVATCANVDVVGWLTVTVIVAVVAHCPAAGVNVYVVVAVLLIAGDHVPMYPLLDVVGILSASPEQIVATCVNVGATGAPTETVIVVGVAH